MSVQDTKADSRGVSACVDAQPTRSSRGSALSIGWRLRTPRSSRKSSAAASETRTRNRFSMGSSGLCSLETRHQRAPNSIVICRRGFFFESVVTEAGWAGLRSPVAISFKFKQVGRAWSLGITCPSEPTVYNMLDIVVTCPLVRVRWPQRDLVGTVASPNEESDQGARCNPELPSCPYREAPQGPERARRGGAQHRVSRRSTDFR